MSNIDEVIKNAYQKVQFEKGSPYTEHGFVKLKEEISSYVIQLVNESYVIAKRSKSDLISQSHVEVASHNLIKKNNSEIRNIFVSIGGFLLGMAVTKTFETLADSEPFTVANSLLIFSTGIVGAFMLGLNIFSGR